ncbi:MAG: cell wall-binding repeat-containing protein [Oscillospiraceae bacterium]|nr:cell wall-binding repeat-containing protein [Oscillospiraceae bacterium]
MAECTVDLFNHEGHAWCFFRLNDEWVLYDPLWLAGGTTDRDYMAKWIYFDTVEIVTPASDSDNLPPEAYDKPKIYYTDGKIYAWGEYYGDEIGVLTSFVNNQAFAFVAYQSDPETGASDGWMYVGSDYDKHQMERGQIYCDSWIAYGDYSTNSAMLIAYAHANGMCIDGGVMTLEGQDYLLAKNESFPILADPDDYTITNGCFTLKSGYKGLFLGVPWQAGAIEGHIVEWENRNPEIATVDSNGIITCHEEGYAEFYVYLKRQEQNGEMTYMGTSIIPVIISDEERIPVYEDPEEAEVIRTYGTNRYNTALAAAEQLKENLGVEKFENIVVACGTDFADALSGSYLANQKNAPILLVNKYSAVMDPVKEYIRENLTPGGTVYLLGGTGVMPAEMETGLEGFEIKRLQGANRYMTNLEILKEAGVEGKPILICTGLDFDDGLSAAAVNQPILLVTKVMLEDQIEYLETLRSTEFYIIGGTGAVNEKVETVLREHGSVQRIEGANRYVTSVNIAKTFFPEAKSVVLAYAFNFPDGLSGGCLAHSMDAPLILTNGGKQAPAVAYGKEAGLATGAVLGGPKLITDSVAKAVFQMS